MPLKILSLNLWHDAGPWKQRLALIREWLARLDPDLVAFQEVLCGPDVDLLRELVGDSERHVAFGGASPFWRNSDLEFGNAVVSRWPIVSRHELKLPDGGDGEARAVISVSIDAPVPGGQLCFSSTHLNWKLHQGAIREQQVVALCDHVLSLAPREGFPPIIAGDFNAEPDSDEIRYMTGLHSIEGRSVHFRDAWKVAGAGGAGCTWSNRNPYARKSFEPDRRIDYIFSGSPMIGGSGFTDSCQVVCDEARGPVWPSDHFGVYAELRLVDSGRFYNGLSAR